MQNQTLLFVILGVIALATTIQAVALVGAFLSLKRLEEKVRHAELELRALQPRIERLGRIVDNLSVWSDAAAENVPRMARGVETAVSRLRDVARVGAMAFIRPLRPLGAALAVLQGVKRGVQAYRDRHPQPPRLEDTLGS